MTVKELLLVLNLKSQPHNTEYNLQYEYKFSCERKSIYIVISMLKFVNHKLVHKIKVYGEIEAIEYITNEIKQYS